MIIKPFNLELAKKISNGERKGEIITFGHNYKVELVYTDNGLGAKGCMLCINIPEYTTFKDGDVLSNEEGDYLFILNTNGEYLTSYHASWQEGGYLYFDNGAANQNNIERYRYATEDEKRDFINDLKASEEPKAKMCLKQFFGIEIEPEYKLKPFDKVLVRNSQDDAWNISLFAREITGVNSHGYECVHGTVWTYCIPYGGNEDLL